MAGLTARDIMTADPVTVEPELPVKEAARLMVEHRVGCLPVLADARFSRVHVLVIELDGQIHAIDTGSKNGLGHNGRRVRRCPLGEDGGSVALGSDLAWLSWAGLH